MTLPNYTQVSNEFIALLPELTGEEVKIFLAISRKTIGWHKESDRIPYSQLKAMTGIRHHVTVKKAVLRLVELGLITMSGDDTVGYTYDLAMSSGDTPPMSRRDTSKETGQKKQDYALSERAAPPGTAPEELVDSPLAKIRQDVAGADAAMQAVFDAEYPKILDEDYKAAMAPRIITGQPPDPKKDLEAKLWARFLAIQPDQRFPRTTYAKERRGVKRLVLEAFDRQPDDPEAWITGYLAAWARLKRDRKSLIYGQPNAPAVMSSGAFVQRVVDEMAQAALFHDEGPGEEIPW